MDKGQARPGKESYSGNDRGGGPLATVELVDSAPVRLRGEVGHVDVVRLEDDQSHVGERQLDQLLLLLVGVLVAGELGGECRGVRALG